MTYGVDFPRVDPQLQQDLAAGAIPPTSGADCSVKTIQGGVRWATRGASIPTVKAIRAQINAPSGGITMSQAVEGYHAFGVTAKLVNTVAEVMTALVAGQFCHIKINYGWVNQNAPELSGQKSFNGQHGLGVYGTENFPPLNANWTCWLDPLGDGRPQGGAKQIVMARLRDITGAMTAVAPNKVEAIVISRVADDTEERILAKNAAFDSIILKAQEGRAL